jgi:hypothetical protein
MDGMPAGGAIPRPADFFQEIGKVKRLRTTPTVLAALFVVAAFLGTVRPSFGTTERRLHDGASSIEELVNRFLDAVGKKDAKALRALRVDRDEYVDLILRGHVPVGTPLRDWPKDVNEYWWSVLHTKSVYWEANILSSFGGHQYRLKHLDVSAGPRQFATYTGYKQLGMTVEDENGTEKEIRTGSIAEVNGRYKFISFIRD